MYKHSWKERGKIIVYTEKGMRLLISCVWCHEVKKKKEEEESQLQKSFSILG